MKTLIEATTSRTSTNGSISSSGMYRKLVPLAILVAIVCASLLMDAALPLRALWFHEALLTQLGSWPVLPSQILFPGFAIIPPLPNVHISGPPDITLSWLELPLLLGTFIAVFLVYILALRRLPEYITRRYLIYSTLLLGFIFILIPVVTSPDLYSYITYARIAVLHHLNPLTTTPDAISTDPIYSYVAWVDQPSAYGPTWAIITSAMQGIFSLFGLNAILPMVIMLRLFGLLMHLLSTILIWSISGHLLRGNGMVAPEQRMRATLAFAWNPLLLLEACVNAHNDATMLFFVLLAVWFLVRNMGTETTLSHGRASLRAAVLSAVMLALATCLKLYVVLFAPGLLFFLWMQRPGATAPGRPQRKVRIYPAPGRLYGLSTIFSDTLKTSLAAVAAYLGIIIALYVPFWQGGGILDVFSVNPAAYRTINSPSEFLAHLYNAIVTQLGFPLGAPVGSPAEHFTHTLSLILFVLIYCMLCWRTLRTPGRISTIPGLVRWMALVWLLYCLIGSPWFWPWYLVTFFGLYAIVEVSSDQTYSILAPTEGTTTFHIWPLMARMLTFSMLSLYSFITWGPQHSIVPGLPGFQWSFFNGLGIWVLPLLGVAFIRWHRLSTTHYKYISSSRNILIRIKAGKIWSRRILT